MRLLILGGTTEASRLARALAGDPGIEPVLSLAGATRAPVLPEIPVRIGGFGGVEGLADWLRATRTDAVIDATHPFAVRITGNAIAATAAAGVRLLRVERPAWQPGPADRWEIVPDMQAAAAALGEAPRTVLLTVGRNDLLPFRAAGAHRFLVRSVDPPPADLLPEGATILTARGPFALEQERALLRDHGVQVLVTKNSGGSAVAAKLEAAREQGVQVVMVARPRVPATSQRIDSVPDSDAALAWLQRLRGTAHGTLFTPRRV